MAGFIIALNQWANFRLPCPYLDETKEQPQCFSGQFSFQNTQLTDVVDLTADDRALDFSLRTLYIDNSNANSVQVAITIAGTNQVVTVPANTQGYYPVLAQDRRTGGANLSLTGNAPNAGAALFPVKIHLINFMVEPFQWKTA